MVNEIPLFSIIVPVYNVENYIERCLISITSQICGYFEVLLVDDASTDSSVKIIEDYIQKNNASIYFKLIKQRENKGVSVSRNVGIRAARGHYIVMIDSDDYVDSEFLKIYEQILDNSLSKIDVIYNQSYFIANALDIQNVEVDNCKSGFVVYNDNHIVRKQFAFSSDYLWQFVFRKSLFENILFPEGCDYEDLLTLPAILANAHNIHTVKKPGYYYVKRGGSITQMRDSLSSRIFPFMKEIWNVYPLWEKQKSTDLFYSRYGKSLRDQLYALAFWVKDVKMSRSVIKQWSRDMPWSFVLGMLKNRQWQNLPVYLFIKILPSQTLSFYKKIKSRS